MWKFIPFVVPKSFYVPEFHNVKIGVKNDEILIQYTVSQSPELGLSKWTSIE